MKASYFTAVLSLTCLLGFGGSAHAARGNARSVEIFDVVQIGTTELKPGNYKVAWQGAGPAVQVSFQQNGKTVVTVPATLKCHLAAHLFNPETFKQLAGSVEPRRRGKNLANNLTTRTNL